MRILIVEDDPGIVRALNETLAIAGYSSRSTGMAEYARTMLNTEPFDLVVLDLGLPGADGINVLRHLRRNGNPMPVLILTARDGITDRVSALDLGADDYLVKPFEPAELTARCRALLRRARGAATEQITIGALRIDFHHKTVSVGDMLCELTRSEWSLLERLAAKAGHIVAKDELCRTLSVDDADVSAHAVEACVSRLRAKLGRDVSISALRGLGYRLDEPRG